MATISTHSVVDPKAHIGSDVEIGPFCVVGPNVTLGNGCRLISHVTLAGHTTVGKNNTFFPNCVVGTIPQDQKYRGGPTRLEIGDGNTIREAATLHLGTEAGGGVTRIGNGNLVMVNCHVGHDALIGDQCILGNNVMIAGHVVCGNRVALMGGVGIHHFVSIGDFAYIGGAARIRHDVPPFVKVAGDDRIRGLNTIGLRRAGFDDQTIEALDKACRCLFLRDKPLAIAMAEFVTQNGLDPSVKKMIDFLRRRDQGIHGRYLESQRAK